MRGSSNSASPAARVADFTHSDDPLRYLPAEPRAKLQRLLDHEAAEQGAIFAISERISEARKDRAHLALVLDPDRPEGKATANSGRPIPLFGDKLAKAKAQHDEADATVKRLEAQRAGIEAQRARIGKHCLEYVKTIGSDAFRLHTEEVRIPRGVTLDKVSEQVATLREQERDVLRRARHSSHRLAEALAWVDRVAERGDPGIEAFFTRGTALKLPKHRIDEPLRGHVISGSGTGGGVVVGAGYEVPDGTAIAVWANRDAIKAQIAATAAAQDDTDAITDDDRAGELARLRSAILEAERVEEALVGMAALAGTPVGRRNDADPRAVLGLSSDLPPLS